MAPVDDGREQVAVGGDTLENGRGVEVEQPRVAPGGGLDLIPGHGRGDGGARASTQRVHAHRRLVRVVLAPVDQDLAPSQVLCHRGDDQLGMAALQELGQGVGEGLRVVVGDGNVEGCVEL